MNKYTLENKDTLSAKQINTLCHNSPINSASWKKLNKTSSENRILLRPAFSEVTSEECLARLIVGIAFLE